MRYLSPTLFFGDGVPFDRKDIQRERKKLLAELELNEGGRLELHGVSFTKNELINYFEDLLQEPVAAYHSAIGRDPVLLGFLQDDRIDEWAQFRKDPLYATPGFIGWISPYFYTAFTTFTSACFELTDAVSIGALLANRLLMTEEDLERGWQSITGILMRNIDLFDDYRGKSRKNSSGRMPSIEIITDYIGHGYIQVIRHLPNSRFAQIKDEYAFSMQHPAIAVFNRDVANRSLALTWVESAEELAVSEDIKASISKKLEELNGIENRRGKRIRSPWNFMWIIVVIVVRLAATSNNSSSSNTSIREPLYVMPPARNSPGGSNNSVPLDKKVIDSILRSGTDFRH